MVNPALAKLREVVARNVADHGAVVEIPQLYVVLVDTASDWPDVVFVGSWDAAVAFDRGISDKYHTSVQAVVNLDVREER